MRNLSLMGVVTVLLALHVLSACGPTTVKDVHVPLPQPSLEGGPTNTEPAPAIAMTEAEARRIAANSLCVKTGALLENAFLNESTGTWWIDLAAEKTGCNPACVVNVRTGEAEVNWRCTGALPEPPTTPAEAAVKVASPEHAVHPSLPTPTEVVMREVLKSDRQRVAAPLAAAEDLSNLISGNSAFAFDLYKLLHGREGNLFYSPYSISLALAMTYAGARGETESQMKDALHFVLSQENLHPAFNGLDIELSRRGDGAQGRDEKGFRLNIVNAIWGQEGFEFLPQFLDVLAENYGAGLRLLDFAQAPEEARVTINDWVSDQTEGRIENLIPQGVIDRLTRLILTNAIYFNAAWQYPFEEEWTREGAFRILDGGEISVPMMTQTESLGYVEDDRYQAVELPYDGQELSMVILLPRTGRFREFQDTLDAHSVSTVLEGLMQRQVTLTMPRFQFESDFSLVENLSAMGMPLAFSTGADLSGMTESPDLFISDVIHKAFVSVDEQGTEAAAATAVIMSLKAVPQEPVEVTVDRPFIFLIRDIETGTILFVGRMLDPSA